MGNRNELGTQQPWPSTKNAEQIMPTQSMPAKEPVDSLTRAAMQEVSDALLNNRPTDWNGNPISEAMMNSLNGTFDLPARGIIIHEKNFNQTE